MLRKTNMSHIYVPYTLIDQLRIFYDSLPLETRTRLGLFDEHELITALAQLNRSEWCDIQHTLFEHNTRGDK